MTRKSEPSRRHHRPSWLQSDLGLGRDNALLFWGHAIWGLGFSLQIAIWPLFIEHLGARPGQIGFVIGAGALVRTVLALPAGALADRGSLKKLIVSMMAVPTLGALVLTQATSWWHAIIGAILMEFSGLAVPAVSAYIAAASTPAGRTRAYTYIFNLSIALGMLVGPGLGGWLAERFGFHIVYFCSALCFAAGVLPLLAITDRRTSTSVDAEAASAIPAGAEPARIRDLFGNRAVQLVLAFHLLVPMIYVGSTLLPNFLHDQRNLSLGTIGLLGSLGSAAALVFALLVSHWRPLSQPFAGMGVTLAMVTVAYALFIVTGNIALIAIAYMLRYSFSAIWSLIAAALADVTPERLRGRAYGIGEVSIGIGDAAAPIGAGLLYGVWHPLPFFVALVIAAPLSVVAWLTHRQRQRAPAQSLVASASSE